MTREASDKHRELEDLLIRGRVNGGLSQDLDDEISAYMVILWWEMTKQEQEEAVLRAKSYSESLKRQT